MKKLIVCVAVTGVAVGAIYLLCKTKKEENVSSKSTDEKFDSGAVTKEETSDEEKDATQEMNVAKGKSAQSISERHIEAAGIMVDAFANIMREIEPVALNEEPVDTVDDSQDVETINKLDSLSNELDELAK